MSMSWPYRIAGVQALGGRRLLLRFDNGGTAEKDFAPLIAAGGVYTPLADDGYWQQMKIGEGGRSLDWPPRTDDELTALSLCADALWFAAHPDDYAAYMREIEQRRNAPVAP
jgi:hypothetical protein